MNGAENGVTCENILGVYCITLNQPEKGNVLSPFLITNIQNALHYAVSSDECRVVLLKGNNGIFCRGMDFSSLAAKSFPVSIEWAENYVNLLLSIYRCPKPVISMIDGEVIAGGMGLILASDIVIATESSVFGFTETYFGLLPAMVYPLLTDRVTLNNARYLVTSSRKLHAREALHFGLIHEVAESEKELEKKTREQIKRLFFSSPEALKISKAYNENFRHCSIEEQLQSGLVEITRLVNEETIRNNIFRFQEGALPEWYTPFKDKILK